MGQSSSSREATAPQSDRTPKQFDKYLKSIATEKDPNFVGEHGRKQVGFYLRLNMTERLRYYIKTVIRNEWNCHFCAERAYMIASVKMHERAGVGRDGRSLFL